MTRLLQFLLTIACLSLSGVVCGAGESNSTGLLIMGLKTYEMDAAGTLSDKPIEFTSVSLKNVRTHESFEATASNGHIVIELPDGSYCLNTFRTDAGNNPTDCRLYILVLGNKISNIGYIKAGIHTEPKEEFGRTKLFGGFQFRRELASELGPEEHAAVRTFLKKTRSNKTSLDGTLWYSFDIEGSTMAFWFDANNDLSIQPGSTTPLSMASRGHWHAEDNHVTFTADATSGNNFYGGVIFEGEMTGEFMSGIAHNMTTGDRWAWYADKDPTVLVPLNTSATARLIFRPAIRYPAEAFANKVTGHVRVRFHLPLPALGINGYWLTASPTNMQIVDSDPAGAFDKIVLNDFSSAAFANRVVDGKAIESDEEETITFSIVDGKPTTAYSSPLETIPAPKAN